MGLTGVRMLEAVQRGELPPPPIFELMGIAMSRCGDGWAELELEVGPRLHNSMGAAHGGVVATLGDAVMGTAVITTLLEGELFTTLDLHANYIRPARETRLTALGRVVRRGRATAHCEAEINDDQGRLVAKLSCNCLIQKGDWTEA